MVYCGINGTINQTSKTCLVDDTYKAGDTDDIVIDFLGTILVVGVSFATLIGLVLLLRWAKKRVK